jgi:hypothetical protein
VQINRLFYKHIKKQLNIQKMRKILALSIALTVFFASCRKDKDDVPSVPSVSITMSPKLGPVSVTPPKTSLKVMEHVVNAVNASDFYIGYGSVDMKVFDGLTYGQLTNVWLVYKNKDDVVYTRKLASTASSSMDFYPDLERPSTTVDTIQVFVDVPSTTTKGRLESDLYVEYEWQGVQSIVRKTIKGQSTTFVASSLTTSISTTTPQSGIVLSDREANALVIDAAAVGQAMKPTSLKISVDGSYIQETRVYVDSTTLVGSVTYNTNSVVTKTIPLNMPSIPSGTTKKLWIRHMPKVMSNGPAVQPNVKTTLLSLDYEGADGVARTNPTAIAGNDLYLFNSMLLVDDVQLSGPIVNGVPTIVKSNKMYTVGGPGAVKQLAYSFNQIDLGAASPIRILNPKLKINGVVANNVVFLNQSRQKLDSIMPSDTKVYAVAISGSGQYMPVTNADATYEIEGTYQGYTDGVDYAKIDLLKDDTQVPATYRYLNTGPVALNVMTYFGLFNGPSPSPSAATAHILYSDKADGPANSGAPGSGSNAWYNGYWVFRNSNTAPQYWYQ